MTTLIRRAWDNRPTLAVELENKGSVARDHLAGERTFLAWLRTSLALVSLGVAIAQLFKLPEVIEPEMHGGASLNDWPLSDASYAEFDSSAPSSDTPAQLAMSMMMMTMAKSPARLDSLKKLGKPLGSTCIALGALCLLLGCYRYFVVQSHLIKGVFPPSRIEISLMALSIFGIIVAAFGIVVGTKLQSL